MHIIYVEDNVANIALMQRICQMSSDTLTTFLDFDSAFAELNYDTCDLIILDLHLGASDGDGLLLAKALRMKGVLTPIVAVTSFDHLYREHYLEAGCDYYINKPISVEQFLATINQYRINR